MKTKRSLTGMFFRYKNPETGKVENWCFEDLPETEQDKYMENRSEEWLKSLAKQLANTINKIAEQVDIIAEEEII